MGERLTTASRPGPRLVGVLGEGSAALQGTDSQQFLGPPAHKAGWAGGPDGEGQDPTLTSLSTSGPPFHCCLNPLINCPFLTIICLWAGPTVALTNDWAILIAWQQGMEKWHSAMAASFPLGSLHCYSLSLSQNILLCKFNILPNIHLNYALTYLKSEATQQN